MDLHALWKGTSFADGAKRRRLQVMSAALDGMLEPIELRGKKILEVGCGPGSDFLRYLAKNDECELYGVDIRSYSGTPPGVMLSIADAASLPFDNQSLDLVVSIGVLEHIEPLEKLCRVAQEIRRVGKRFCVIVPSISTVIEPHNRGFLWQLRAPNTKMRYPALNYLSDEAWLSMEGFSGAKSSRFFYVPGLIANLMIVG